MAITRAKKEDLVAQYKALIEQTDAMVFTDYRGITVQQVQALRAALKESGSTYTVVKNTLFRIALEQSSKDVHPNGLLDGPNGVAFMGEDIAKSMTALKNWLKTSEVVQVKGAILESSVLSATETDALSELPTKEQILAKLLGMINAPASSLVRVINAPATDLTRIINAPQSSLAGVINAYVQKQQADAA